MARMVRDYRLETRSARERLRVQSEPYWRLLDRGLYLGYRKLGGEPKIELGRNYGLSEPKVREALRLVAEHENEIRAAWHEQFDS